MKNGMVIADHHGDNGTVRAGMILRDLTTQRFQALETAKLIREATEEEASAGYQPEIDADPTKGDGESEGGAEGDDGDGKAAAKPANKKAAEPANKGA